MEKFLSKDFKGNVDAAKMEDFVIRFYDLLEEENMEDTAGNRLKTFDALLEKHPGELNPEEISFLKKAVLLKEEKKKELSYVPNRRERRNFID